MEKKSERDYTMSPFVDFEHPELANECFHLRSFIGPDLSDKGCWIAEYYVIGLKVVERLESMLTSADWVGKESSVCKPTDFASVVVKLNGIPVTVARLIRQKAEDKGGNDVTE